MRNEFSDIRGAAAWGGAPIRTYSGRGGAARAAPITKGARKKRASNRYNLFGALGRLLHHVHDALDARGALGQHPLLFVGELEGDDPLDPVAADDDRDA